MSENNQTTQAPASSNQNTLIVIVIAMLVIIALLMFFNMSQNPAIPTTGNSDKTTLLAHRESVAALERELEAKGIPLPVDTTSIDALSNRISKDAMQLRTNIEQFQEALSSKEVALTKAQSDLQAAITTNQNLSTEASKLRTQLAGVQDQQASVQFYKQELDKIKTTLVERDKQIDELSKRPTPETVNQFRAQLNQTMLNNEKLNMKVQELELAASNSADADEVQKLREENQQLRVELQGLKADNDYDSLYAKSAEELRPEAAKLYADLAALEGLTPDQLEAAYMRISLDHNAVMKRSVRFPTNSSAVEWATLSGIKDTITTSNKDSFFLVVGYASKTGNADSNKILSAKRSVTIASVVKELKKGTGTRAVFLGQTNRFSTNNPLENQICEIWELRK